MNQPDPAQQPYRYRYPDLPPAPANPPVKPPVRVVYHPGPIAPRGIALNCPACAANRNWLMKGAELHWLQHPVLNGCVEDLLLSECVGASPRPLAWV